MAGEIKRGIWDNKIRLCVCEREGCNETFERKPHTGRKYCYIHIGQKIYKPKPRKPLQEQTKTCINPACKKEYQTLYPYQKYCNFVCTRQHEATKRREERRKPIVNHDDCCGCGGCLGVESRRK